VLENQQPVGKIAETPVRVKRKTPAVLIGEDGNDSGYAEKFAVRHGLPAGSPSLAQDRHPPPEAHRRIGDYSLI
jgi:hypothetical protein